MSTIIEAVFDNALASMRGNGMNDQEIMQWAAENCPCDDCRAKRGQPPKEHFAIPHEHAEGRRSNYFPLILTDVRYMAMKAFQAENEGNSWTVNDIMRRLCQAIPGQTCPRKLGGHVDKVEVRLCEYYLHNVKFHGADPTFAEEIYAIINS